MSSKGLRLQQPHSRWVMLLHLMNFYCRILSRVWLIILLHSDEGNEGMGRAS